MILAEAIQEKTSLKKEVVDLREKLEHAAAAVEGTKEDPVRLLGKLEDSLRRMEYLSAAIFHTNDRIRIDGKTMTQLIYKRDTLFFRMELYKNLIRLMENAEGSAATELSIPELQNKATRMRLEMRSLTEQIQKTNWTKELIENENQG